jgi:hypothetical protein
MSYEFENKEQKRKLRDRVTHVLTSVPYIIFVSGLVYASFARREYNLWRKKK